MITIGNATVHYSDCIEGMKNIPDKSIDLVFADPPYNIKKPIENDDQTNEEYVSFSREWLVEACRVLKDTGSIYVMCSVRYQSYIFRILNDEIGLDYINTIIWAYSGNSHNVKDELLHNHEPILFFTRSRTGKTFNMDDMRDKEAFARFDKANNRKGKALSDVWKDITNLRWNNGERYGFYKKNAKGEIVEKGHPTQKPEKLLQRIILLSSNPGDVVLDPFAGSGTCGVICLRTGRKYIGFESDLRWKGMIEKRVRSEFKKAISPKLDEFMGKKGALEKYTGT